MNAMPRQILLISPRGVVGSAIADRLGGSAEWELTTASRRGAASEPGKSEAGAHSGERHVSVDLLDAAAELGKGVDSHRRRHVGVVDEGPRAAQRRDTDRRITRHMIVRRGRSSQMTVSACSHIRWPRTPWY